MVTHNFVDPKRNGAVFPTDKARAEENWRRAVPPRPVVINLPPHNQQPLTAQEVIQLLLDRGWSSTRIGPAIGRGRNFASHIFHGHKKTSFEGTSDLISLLDKEPQRAMTKTEVGKLGRLRQIENDLNAEKQTANEYNALATALNKQADDFAKLVAMVRELRADVDAIRDAKDKANPGKRIAARLDAIERQLSAPAPEPVRLPWWRRWLRR